MTSQNHHYVDQVTDQRYALGDKRWRSDEGNPLAISDLPGISADDIDRSQRSLWRYKEAFPVDIPRPVSLGEGCTPLIPHPGGFNNAHLKLEWFAPTGSFKDRGASVMVSFLKQIGIGHILEDSSGNGGAAIAAYGAAAGLDVKVLAPSYTQPAKVAQIRAFGAEVELVPGPREASEEEAIRQAETIFYASHNWHPFFLQGTKTLGYELWEDLGFTVPDNVIIPMGAGSNVLGCDIAFDELLRSGAIRKRPKLFGVQPQNCAPIDASFKAGSDILVDTEFAPTIAEGTAIKKPVRLKPVLDAIRRSGGATVTVSEDEIVARVKSLAGHGLYVEPTSAGADAAYQKLAASGAISANERSVIILTGSGLKATGFMTDLFAGT